VILYLDLETYNENNIKEVGTYEYARTAEVLLFAYAIDDGPAKVWDVTLGMVPPSELADALVKAGTLVAHNAMFDRNVIRHALSGVFDQPIDRWWCTMAQALSHALPAGLGDLGRVLKLGEDTSKLKDGKALINRFCKPAPRNHKADRYDRESHPEEWDRFTEYARLDVEAMREVLRRLPAANYGGDHGKDGLLQWRLDQVINDRGFAVDQELVRAGASSSVREKEVLASRFRELTRGEVHAPTQRAKLRTFLCDNYPLDISDTRKETLIPILRRTDIPSDLRELLEITIAGNKTSTAKYAALEPATSPDRRFRGGLQYSGASRTRRWSGRGFQPHNLPSRGLPKEREVEAYIRALKAGCEDFLFEDLMRHGSAALRGVVVAPAGRKLVVSDLSNIEGRINPWLAGEKWKLEAFKAFDRGEGPDLYNVMAGSLLGQTPDEVSSENRGAFGKVPELSLGYQGGVSALQNFAAVYAINMAEHLPTIRANVGDKFLARAQDNWDSWGEKRNDGVVPVDEWIASEAVKLAWRSRHPAICRLWYDCENAAVAAIRSPGEATDAGRLRFKMVSCRGSRYLTVLLPSGRYLMYFDPKLTADGKISYMGVDSITKKWCKQHTYGGKLVENACQSLARDVLAESMDPAETAGYQVVLTVHDELVTETDDTPEYTAEALSEILARNPPWSTGLPLAAKGFTTKRYRKD